MENVSPRKLIAVVAIVSVAVSVISSIAAVSLFSGLRPAEVVGRVTQTASGGLAVGQNVTGRVKSGDEPIVAIVKQSSSSVVSIVASKDVPVIEKYYVDPFGGDPFFNQFFGGDPGLQIPQYRQKGTTKQEVSAGTGFIVSADGLILTNKHVVADTAADYTVFLNDGTKISAKVLARDPVQDLAVVKIEKTGLTPLPLGSSADLAIGQTAIIIGNALGEFSNTVSVGIVSGLHRSITASGGGSSEELQELIQTDAAINPGNSGGPMLDLQGNAIGISVAMAQGAENIGFAIPIDKAKRDIESVKATGRIIYPFLGVRYVMVTKDIQAQEKLPVDYGALVSGDANDPAVTAGSPAGKAGVKSGDIILQFNGERVDTDHTLASLIQKYKVGDEVAMQIRRGDTTMSLKAVLIERK